MGAAGCAAAEEEEVLWCVSTLSVSHALLCWYKSTCFTGAQGQILT
jgi:hypothetical protein